MASSSPPALETKEDTFKPHGKRKREEMDSDDHGIYGSDSCDASSTASAEIQRERLKQLLPGNDAELRSKQKTDTSSTAVNRVGAVKVFECELCGKHFTNGQKKGGHKRACKQKLEQQGLYHLVLARSIGQPPTKKQKHAAKKKKRKKKEEAESPKTSTTTSEVDASSSATRMKLGMSSKAAGAAANKHASKKNSSNGTDKGGASVRGRERKSPTGKARKKKKKKSKTQRHQQMVQSINASIDAVLARKNSHQSSSVAATSTDGDGDSHSSEMDVSGSGDGCNLETTATTTTSRPEALESALSAAAGTSTGSTGTVPMSTTTAMPMAASNAAVNAVAGAATAADSEGSDTLFSANTFGTEGNNMHSFSCSNQPQQLGVSGDGSIGHAQAMMSPVVANDSQLNLDPTQLSQLVQLSQFNNLLSTLASPVASQVASQQGSMSGTNATQQSPNSALLQLLQYFALLQSLSGNGVANNNSNLQTAMANNAALQSLPFQFFENNNNNAQQK